VTGESDSALNTAALYFFRIPKFIGVSVAGFSLAFVCRETSGLISLSLRLVRQIRFYNICCDSVFCRVSVMVVSSSVSVGGIP
jgi:hypothetical protein